MTAEFSSALSEELISDTEMFSQEYADFTSYETVDVKDQDQFDRSLAHHAPTDADLGEGIIDKSIDVVENIVKSKGEAHELSSNLKSDISPRELLGLQMKLMSSSLQIEVTSKIVGKNNQNIDTMMKAQ